MNHLGDAGCGSEAWGEARDSMSSRSQVAPTLDSKILETFALNLVPPFPGPCTLSLSLGAALLTFIVRGVHPAPKMGYS